MAAKVEEAIERYIDGESPEIPFSEGEDIGIATDYAIGRNRYIGYLISLATRSYSGKRVGLDCANGASFSIAKSVFDALGAKTYVIHTDPNGLNINKDCGSTNINSLVELVKAKDLDVGFAFDGDADRCIAVDNVGRVIDGDHIIYICGKYLKNRQKLDGNHVVVTIMSNLGLFKALDQAGIEYDVTKVGDKYVNEDMEKNGFVLGGEQSGHIIFSRYATTGDGILTAIMLMETILESKTDLKTLASGMQKYPQLLKNVRVEDKQAVLDNEAVQACCKDIEEELGDNGRLLLRESGTEPVIRVMVEASSDQLCQRYVDIMIDCIKKQGLA